MFTSPSFSFPLETYLVKINDEEVSFRRQGLLITEVSGTRLFYLNYGSILFHRQHTLFLLTLGIHPNKTLQSLYNNNPSINFYCWYPRMELSEAKRDYKEILKSWSKHGIILNEKEDNFLNNIDYSHPRINERMIDVKKPIYQVSNSHYITGYVFFNRFTKDFYIGSGDRYDRRSKQLKLLSSGKHINKKFQASFDTNPNFEHIWVPFANRELAYGFEQTMLDRFGDSRHCLNISLHVDRVTWREGERPPVTEEAKRKISTWSKNYWDNNPEAKINMGNRNRENYAALSIEEKTKLAKAARKRTLERYKDPEERKKTGNAIRQAYINNPGFREKVSKANKEYSDRPEVKEKRRLAKKEQWKDPEKRKLFIERIKKSMESPEYREKISKISKAYHSRPDVKEKFAASIRKRFENPEYRRKAKERAKINGAKYAKKISAGGVIYSSIKEGARQMGIKDNTLSYRLNSKHFPDYFYL